MGHLSWDLQMNMTTTWWRHQMETFSALLAICAGNSSVAGEFPAKRPATRSFDVFFDLRLNKRLSKQAWGWWFETLSRPLWRHCNDISTANCILSHWKHNPIPCYNTYVFFNILLGHGLLELVCGAEVFNDDIEFPQLPSLASLHQKPKHTETYILQWRQMSAMASQIISLTIVYSIVYSDEDQRKHQSSASQTFERGIHRWPANSPHKGPVTRKCFHLMTSSWT